MWLPFGMIAAMIGWLVSRPVRKEIPSVTISMSVREWEPILLFFTSMVKLNLQFALAWIQKESGGNPCAWGSATAKGPDGHPREQGIAQLYNPDDMKTLGIASGALRVYCIPGTQKCSRALTSEEIRYHAEKAVALMVRHRDKARDASVKNRLTWNERDFYRLVKLDHALPGLVRTGVALVTRKLGYAPRDWAEYRRAVDTTKMDAGTERYRKEFSRLLDNAESVGGVVPLADRSTV